MNFIHSLILFIFGMQSIYAIDRHVLACNNPIENGERRIVVVIASYNNKEWYQKNLDSVFSQKYENYRIIYIDDCSGDRTGDLVEQYVKEKGQDHRFLLIKNTERYLKMANTYRAYHLCNDTDVIIELDGDDWLMHDQVFARYNEIYRNPNIWMTYGNFMEWPTGSPQIMTEIEDEVIQANSFRKKKECCFWAGLRTYYAWLVKEIKLKDVLFRGEFLPMTSDTAIMLPMFEMAGNRYAFLTEMMLEHNVATSLNDHKVNCALQNETCFSVLARNPYKKLKGPIINRDRMFLSATVDLYVISNKSPERLNVFLESLGKVSGLGNVTVLYSFRDDAQRQRYQAIFEQIPEIVGVVHTDNSKLGTAILGLACNGSSVHCMFTNDKCPFIAPVDLKECIHRLEQTQAQVFMLAIDKNCMPKNKQVWVGDDVYASQYVFGGRLLVNIHTVSMAVFRTQDVQEAYIQMPPTQWSSYGSLLLNLMKKDSSNVALFF